MSRQGYTVCQGAGVGGSGDNFYPVRPVSPNMNVALAAGTWCISCTCCGVHTAYDVPAVRD